MMHEYKGASKRVREGERRARENQRKEKRGIHFVHEICVFSPNWLTCKSKEAATHEQREATSWL